MPKQKDFPTTPKELKKLFTKNLTIIKPFTQIVDSIQFNESVFTEWKCFSTNENSKTQFGLVFRKQIPSQFLHSTTDLSGSSIVFEETSVAYSLLKGTPSFRKTLVEDSILNPEIESTSLEKPIEISIKIDKQQKCCLFDQVKHQIKYSLNGKKPIVKIASFVCRGDQLAAGIKATISGIVNQITKMSLEFTNMQES